MTDSTTIDRRGHCVACPPCLDSHPFPEHCPRHPRYEPCPACASRGFGLPCSTHGATYQSGSIGAPVDRDRARARVVATVPAFAPRPLVLVDITGGLETATYTYAGVGDPEVVVCDFDDETDDQAELAASLDDFAARIRERSDHPDDLRAAAGYEDDAARARRWAAEDYD